jgi:hypothetical protein
VNRQNFLNSLTGFPKRANLILLQLGETVRESSNYWHDDYGYDDYSAHKCKRGFPSVLSQPVTVCKQKRVETPHAFLFIQPRNIRYEDQLVVQKRLLIWWALSKVRGKRAIA